MANETKMEHYGKVHEIRTAREKERERERESGIRVTVEGAAEGGGRRNEMEKDI